MSDNPKYYIGDLEQERAETRKEFDRLVIRRFREMIIESSDPEMFVNFDEDVKQLVSNRHL
jgi:hypothetical protein